MMDREKIGMNNKPCLMVVDREQGTLSVVSRSLSRAGYQVIEVQNGMAVLHRPPTLKPDAILLSSRLAGVDGFKTAAQLKSHLDSWNIPILLLLPRSEPASGASPDLFGAEGYIEIPCPTQRLVEKVESVLAEKRIQENLQAKARARLEEGLSQLLEQTVQQLIAERTQHLVDQLSAGLVDLVEEEARSQMQKRIASLAEREGRELIAAAVKELSAPVINEIAEDAVSRQVSAMIDEKADAMIGRFEKEDMPDIGRRVIEQTATAQMPRIVQEAVQGSTKQIAEDIKTQLPRLIENLVSQSLPKIAQQRLGPLVESQADGYLSSTLPRRIKDELEGEMEHLVRPALKKQMMKIVWVGVLLLVLAAGAGVVLGRLFQ